MPYDDEQRRLDRETHPSYERLLEKQSELQKLEAELAGLPAPGGAAALITGGREKARRAELETAIPPLKQEVTDLEEAVSRRRTYRFEDLEQQWEHDTLFALAGDLERWASDNPAESPLAEMRQRLELIDSIEGRSLIEAKAAWDAARIAIKEHPLYAGLDLGPQIGLVPIGPDPDSTLWEFAHLPSGEPAVRGEDEKLVLTPKTGIVLVLMPGG